MIPQASLSPVFTSTNSGLPTNEMNAPLKNSHARGFSKFEALIVLTMLFVLGGFVLFSLSRRDRTTYRTDTAVEIGNYLQKARADSIKRQAKDFQQMAQVKIFNRRYYSVAFDGDGDGNLDIPLVKSLPEEGGVEISGPFPKNYIFNWQGETVDMQNNRVIPPTLIVGNTTGASAIQFSEDGQISVIPAGKLVTAR